MPIFLDVLHLGNRKPARARATVKAVLRQCSLKAVKTARRRNQSPKKDQHFEHPVRKLRVRMQYLVDPPFRFCSFPRPPAIEHQPKLVSAGLGILNNRAANFPFNADTLELLRKSPCKCGK